MGKSTKKDEITKARADRDALDAKVNEACANLVTLADRVVQRLRKRAPRSLRLVKASSR